MNDIHTDARRHRTRRLKLAVVFSIASKLAGAITQIVALTLGVRLLGMNQYSAYATITATAAAPGLLMIGYGPTLIAKIAKLDAEKRTDTLGATMHAVLWTMCLNATVVGILATIAIYSGSVVNLLPNLARLQSVGLQHILAVVLWMNLFGYVCNAMEAVQAGFQENYLLNIRTMIGSLLSLAAIGLGFTQNPTLAVFVYCLLVPLFATRLINLFVIYYQKAFLRPTTFWPDLKLTHGLIGDGVVYTVCVALGAYLSNHLPIVLFAWQDVPLDVMSVVVVTLALVLQAFGVISMIATPYVPAFSNSVASGDIRWADRSFKKVISLIVVYGLCCILGFAAVGPEFCSWWFRNATAPSRTLLVMAGIYLLAIGIENFLFFLVCAIHKLRIAAMLFLTRASVSACISYFAARESTPEVMFLGWAVATAIITIGPFIYLILEFSKKEHAKLDSAISDTRLLVQSNLG